MRRLLAGSTASGLQQPSEVGAVAAGRQGFGEFGELVVVDVALAPRDLFEAALHQLAATDPWLKEHPLEISWSGGQFESGEIPYHHPLVQLCGQCMRDLSGAEPGVAGAPYGSDLRLFVNQGNVPALLLGPGDVRVAHMPDERVAIAEIIQAARAYILLALRYLSGAPAQK